MGGEHPPEVARLRVPPGPPLRRLSITAIQPASPAASSPLRAKPPAALDTVWLPEAEAADGTGMAVASSSAGADTAGLVPGLPPLQNGAAHEHSASLGGSSDQASPRFLELLRNSLLLGEEEGDSGSVNDSSGASAGGTQHHQPPSDTLSKLHALNGNAAAHVAAGGGALANGSAAPAPSKPHKRSLLRMFKPGKSSKQAGASAANGSSGHSSKHNSDGEKKKKGSTWFGSTKSSPDNPAAKPPLHQSLPQSPAVPATGTAATEQAGQRGMLLPGLPVLAAAPSADLASVSSEEVGFAAGGSAAAGGSTRPDSAQSLRQAAPSTVQDYSSASDFSAPSSAQPSPAVGTLGLPPGVDVPANGKKGHSRHRSITSMLVPGWRRRSRHTSVGSEGELGGDITPTRGGATPSRQGSSPAPKSAEALAAAAAAAGFVTASASSLEGELVLPLLREPQAPLLPPGTTGLRNIGNTCFVNAALQCLRYTPGLPLHVAPDLLQRAKQQGQQQQGQAAGGAELEPAAGEDVHAQALARASMDVRPSEAQAAAQAPAGPGQASAAAAAAEEGAVSSVAVAAAKGEQPLVSSAAAGSEGEAAKQPAAAFKEDAAVDEAVAGEATEAKAEPAALEVKGGSEAGAEVPSSGEASDAATSSPAAPAAAAAPVPAPAAAGGGQSQQQASPGLPPQPQQQPQQQQQAVAAAAPAKPKRPAKGELLKAFAELVRELYVPPPGANSSAVCATPMLRILRAFPVAADYFDGGQHDCHDLLRTLIDLLHDDLNRAVPPQRPAEQPSRSASDAATAMAMSGSSPPSSRPLLDAEQAADEASSTADEAVVREAEEDLPQPSPRLSKVVEEEESAAQDSQPDVQPDSQPGLQQQQDGKEGQNGDVEAGQESKEEKKEKGEEKEEEEEGAKAGRLWQQYLERDNSIITDLFGGQLQSAVMCHKCGGRFTQYEPFMDLSLEIAKEAKGGSFSWLGLKGSAPASIQDCLTAFTADEKMEGAEAFYCEKCKDKTAATKQLRLHRFPEVLVLHIKRFKYKGATTDKLTANVSFPIKGLRLHQYASPECPAGPDECTYDLFAVANHYGNLSGGHYTAMCRVPQAGGQEAWYSFNDEQVTRVSTSQLVSQYAYVLWYIRTPNSTAANHRRNHSAASAGAGGGQ